MEMTFGDWLKVRRRQLDLTQKELAYRVGCGLGTLRKLENGSRRPSKELAARIGEALQVPEKEMPAFVKFVRSDPDSIQLPSFAQEQIIPPQVEIPKPEPPYVSPPPHNLPFSLTRIIGRDGEIAELTHLLLRSPQRLITLVGVGGIGKTRLATAVAHSILAGPENPFHDGIFFISLAAFTNWNNIVPVLGQVIGLQFAAESRSSKEQLLDYLRYRNMLLIMDNFEQIQEGFSILLDILQTGAGIKILVTSREALSIQGEQNYPLRGLSYPNQLSDLNELTSYGAPVLFIERATTLHPNFDFGEGEIEVLLLICKLVGGMPLAIILASAWLELLTSGEIAAEIQKNVDFLAADYQDLPQRQRSMRAVFDTSWNRLNEQEQNIFTALSVFRGGFTLEAAQEITGASFSTLLGLVNRSLLSREDTGRFEIHELLRQFAAEQLSHSSTRESAIRNQHSDYFMALLQRCEIELKGSKAEKVLEMLEMDFENVQKGWEWALSQQKISRLGEGVFSLAYFCHRQSRFETGLKILGNTTRILGKHIDNTNSVDPTILATQIRLLAHQCDLLIRFGDLNNAEASGRKAMNLLNRSELQEIDHQREEALVLRVLSEIYVSQDRTEESIQLSERSLSILETLDDSWEKAQLYRVLGVTALKQVRVNDAMKFHNRALRLYEELGHLHSIASARSTIGFDLGALGQLDKAENIIRNSIEVFREIKAFTYMVKAAGSLSEILIYNGKFKEARASAEEGLHVYKRLGIINLAIHFRWCWAEFHLGDFDKVLDEIPEILDMASAHNRMMTTAMIEFSAGCACLGLGQLEKGREQLENSANKLREIRAGDYLCYALSSLCCAYILEKNLTKATAVLLEAANIIKELGIEIMLAPVIASAALFLLARGDRELAIEFYALAELKPYVANSRWFEDIIGRPIAQAAATLLPETVASAQERGRSLDLWQTAESLLQELSPNH